ncbi:MAG: hypothetical protein COV52_08800 [Gammaproteobacteria bacterium CG11_big_fil_rev_8_21_14_0_20_46_22]|nr:MAG: hypothetical protein COW05_09900 [Gammaproteobacteria bacterium CG12_big_fil_rev_8_21_14_0_65_46_12]PIR10378.1 MAG: hypothetical protein COV52_08800 [Gammaproteobacteria bacterium CG11_big_fil_rev_8_21_14_0_20_46_22]
MPFSVKFCRFRFFVFSLVGLSASGFASVPIASPYINLGGFAQWYMPGGGDHYGVNHQSYFRRARLFADGKMNAHFSYKVEYDFAYYGEWRNIWVNYKRGDNNLRVGQQKVPFNSVYDQSPEHRWFAEMALPVQAFNPNFRRGVAYRFNHRDWQAAVSAFAPGTQSQAKINHPYGSTQRFVWAPWHETGRVLQLGLGNWYQRIDHRRSFGYGTIPEATGYVPVATIRTGAISNVNHFDVASADAQWEYHRFASEMGYLYNHTSRTGAPNLDFTGWYAQFGAFIDDNTFTYSSAGGVFGAPKSMNHTVQAIVRLSELDLNSHDIHGGKELDTTIGLNSYFYKHLRLGLNYVFADVRDSQTTTNGGDNIVIANLQLMF